MNGFCYILAAVVAAFLLAFVVECVSVVPTYVLEDATVRKVVPNPPWHYVGCTEITLIKFDDGFATEMSGNRGEPGDRIKAHRARGTASLFGLMADKRF